MVLQHLWELIEPKLRETASTSILFNQYKDEDPELDVPDAPVIRRENLRLYLASFQEKPRVLVVGEAAGPRGCRFSGVPFTGEKHICATTGFPFTGERSSRGNLRVSPTSKIFWREMRPRHPLFLAWDCVPFHPHKQGEPLSIRTPSLAEIRDQSKLLAEIVRALQPVRVVAIGRKAEKALRVQGINCTYVRHPSQGGARRFAEGMSMAFSSMP
jgi:uracil-DNA glycosylase